MIRKGMHFIRCIPVKSPEAGGITTKNIMVPNGLVRSGQLQDCARIICQPQAVMTVFHQGREKIPRLYLCQPRIRLWIVHHAFFDVADVRVKRKTPDSSCMVLINVQNIISSKPLRYGEIFEGRSIKPAYA
jgi:hypothetical protein